MGEPSPGMLPPTRPQESRLDSWKEIATYLHRDVKTVQRWEKREGMPVHRHLHDRMGSVYASRTELDAWVRGRNLRTEQESENKAPAPNPPALPQASLMSIHLSRWRFVLPLGLVAAALAIDPVILLREE